MMDNALHRTRLIVEHKNYAMPAKHEAILYHLGLADYAIGVDNETDADAHITAAEKLADLCNPDDLHYLHYCTRWNIKPFKP